MSECKLTRVSQSCRNSAYRRILVNIHGCLHAPIGVLLQARICITPNLPFYQFFVERCPSLGYECCLYMCIFICRLFIIFICSLRVCYLYNDIPIEYLVYHHIIIIRTYS